LEDERGDERGRRGGENLEDTGKLQLGAGNPDVRGCWVLDCHMLGHLPALLQRSGIIQVHWVDAHPSKSITSKDMVGRGGLH